MAARQDTAVRRPARVFARLLVLCAVPAGVAAMHTRGRTAPQPRGREAAARTPQAGATQPESRAIGMPRAADGATGHRGEAGVFAPEAASGGNAAGSARSGAPAPALFPDAFLIPPPLVLRT